VVADHKAVRQVLLRGNLANDLPDVNSRNNTDEVEETGKSTRDREQREEEEEKKRRREEEKKKRGVRSRSRSRPK